MDIKKTPPIYQNITTSEMAMIDKFGHILNNYQNENNYFENIKPISKHWHKTFKQRVYSKTEIK